MKPLDFVQNLASLRARLITRWFHVVVWLKLTLRSGVPLRLWPLFLAFGLIIGIGLKFGAKQFVTLGYNDYLLPPVEQLYDFPELERRLLAGESLTPEEAPSPYPSCSLYE